ncbi:hypothetical protein SIN09_37555, partial [Streptomyces sp. F8]|nr:hypothetical protein [Streptomyces sp. F8]
MRGLQAEVRFRGVAAAFLAPAAVPAFFVLAAEVDPAAADLPEDDLLAVDLTEAEADLPEAVLPEADLVAVDLVAVALAGADLAVVDRFFDVVFAAAAVFFAEAAVDFFPPTAFGAADVFRPAAR